MKVKVYAPPVFCDDSVLDEANCLELPEDAKLKDVYQRLKINPLLRRLLICTVNQKRCKMNHQLKENDSISFFSPVAGG